MRKVLVLDLDGTLTNSEKKITEKTKEALMRMQKEGHIVVLASGRPTPGVIPVAKELQLAKYDGYILSYNGAQIIQCSTGDTVYEQTLPEDIVSELFQMADELDVGLMTYGKEGAIANLHHDEFMELETRINHMALNHYENPMEHISFAVNKCLGTAPVEQAPEIEKKFARKFGNRISVSRSEPFFIELVPMGINKAASLARLCEVLGCTKEDMIACGDGLNDISMIEFAGVGVAMENAQKPVKKVADYITRSNNEDGIAHVIHKFVLS
ncbi:MAG: Cof-type HAD-IIB family hydrolase [Butyribacter sp.]|nr:Cof-type HAD-IIB family hydrolase [Butyribacter sp.]